MYRFVKINQIIKYLTPKVMLNYLVILVIINLRIEGQIYEEKKHNDINIFTSNRICSRKYNPCYKWKFEHWI